jgi:hypothetical protein
VIGLISRLTDQKGLDLVNAVFPEMLDDRTQVVILGTGDPRYEGAFRYYESENKGKVCAYISYNEALSHQIYAGADALLVPSLFEPCGLTQLIAMRYGTVPIVRETGGLKDTVEPYNQFTNGGNGFTFDRYETGLLLDAVNRAKTLYFTGRCRLIQIALDLEARFAAHGEAVGPDGELQLDVLLPEAALGTGVDGLSCFIVNDKGHGLFRLHFQIQIVIVRVLYGKVCPAAFNLWLVYGRSLLRSLKRRAHALQCKAAYQAGQKHHQEDRKQRGIAFDAAFGVRLSDLYGAEDQHYHFY